MKNSTRRAGRILLPIMLALLIVPAATPPAGADDQEGAEALEMRIFRVGALTMGKRHFIGEAAPPVLPHQVGDEENPLFGAEGERPYYPAGQVDELIELLKGGVDPSFWEETRGADMRSMGDGHLVVHATPAVHDAIARFLARFESEMLRSTRVDIRAVPFEETHALPRDPAELELLLAGPEGGLALSFVAWTDQRVSAASGRQYAYLVDYDTQVAQDSTISDPSISVANLGLMADVRLTPAGSGNDMLVDAWIRLAEMEASRATSTGEHPHRTVETPTFEKVVTHSLIAAPAGMWKSAGGGAGWAFFVRATPASYEAPAAKVAPLLAFTATGGSHELRYFNVQDLAAWTYPVRGCSNHLWPSRFTPPEPPELREPKPFCSAGQLVELIRNVGDRPMWEDPATMEARNGRLIVRNDAGVLAGTERLIAALRKQFLWSVKTTVDLVDMPADLARKLQGRGAGAYVLDAATTQALAEALQDGRAHREAGAEVLNRRASYNSVSAGRRVSYLQDYEVEIAQGAAIANPVIQTFFSGLQLTLLMERTSAGDAVALEARVMQSEHREPMRKLETPTGQLEMPELDVFRVRTSLVVPLGRTVVLASQGEGERRRVLLLTPTLEPAR